MADTTAAVLLLTIAASSRPLGGVGVPRNMRVRRYKYRKDSPRRYPLQMEMDEMGRGMKREEYVFRERT